MSELQNEQFPLVELQGMREREDITNTKDSRPIGSFFTQVDHLFLANSFIKQAINPADFFTLKISEPSDC